MSYSKEQMLHDYYWTDSISAVYTGSPSRRLFDPKNGVQVLFIINCFCDSLGLASEKEYRNLEELIHSQLPADTKSELAVFNWLKGIYLYHAN